ncbi:MAG: CDP-archaeol synthase [Candidatus Paceibacterota bacterium]|jgi:CDP-2,3-bis-(O-geranylgeranyl)-sn-glycerol synthase
MIAVFSFLFFIFSCLYFFLPIYLANMTPPLVKNLPFLRNFNTPVDFGFKLRNHYLFGDHKTWRGVICAIMVGTVAVLVQGWLESNFKLFQKISLVDYGGFNLFSLGILMSAGAMAGDLGAAFIKRRIDLKPGEAFMPWDQTNYVIGSFIFLQPYVHFSWIIWTILFVSTFFLHLLINRWGYMLGLHKAKW